MLLLLLIDILGWRLCKIDGFQKLMNMHSCHLFHSADANGHERESEVFALAPIPTRPCPRRYTYCSYLCSHLLRLFLSVPYLVMALPRCILHRAILINRQPLHADKPFSQCFCSKGSCSLKFRLEREINSFFLSMCGNNVSNFTHRQIEICLCSMEVCAFFHKSI